MMPFHPGDPGSGEFDDAALARYFAGECDEREEIAIRRWIEADPERVAEIGRLRGVWEASRGEQPDVEAALAKVLGASRPRRIARSASWRRFATAGGSGPRVAWAAAAALVLAVGVAALWRASTGEIGDIRVREFATPAGSRTSVTLRDGTRLVLGPATHLRILPFVRRERVVELDGEAVFTVVHDARHPFVVRTLRGDVHDVGTTFVVQAYSGDARARVAVSEGVVDVRGATLGARDMATLDSSGLLTVARGVAVARYFDWTRGALVFEDTPLRDAVRDMARMYDLDITIADSGLAAKVVTASFANEPVDEVLNDITRAVGARYERTGRTVVIRRSTAPAVRPAGTVPAVVRMASVGTR